MITLRRIGSILKARAADTWMLSKTLTLSEGRVITSITLENDQSTVVEKTMKTHIEEGNISDALKLFEDARKEPGISWTVEGASSLLHMFMTYGEHKAVDRLFADMQTNVSYIGDGAKTTMIKSYCQRQQFDKAVEMLRSMTDKKVIHHTRHFDYVIKSLAQNGHGKKAFQLFDEKCQLQGHCYASKGDRSLTVDKEMIVSLLNPSNVPRRLSREDKKLKESSVEVNAVVSHKSEDDDDTTDDGKMETYKLYGGMSLKVFHHLQHSGIKLHSQLLQVIRTWFKHDPYYRWTWNTSKVSEIGLCSNCGNQLTSGISPSDISQLESEIIKLSCDVIQNVSLYRGKKLDNRMCEELDNFKQFVKEKGPFDVIIDGLNVGLHGSMANRQNMVFSTDRLQEVTNHFFVQKKKVLLIIRHKALVRNEAESLVHNLEKVCFVFANKFNNDDLYLLYAAAFSGMQHVQVVTNDRLRDHRLLLPINLWWTFLRWTRLNCLSFTTDISGKLKFTRQKFDSVVQRAGNSWHFPAKDDTWRCVTRVGVKKALECDSD